MRPKLLSSTPRLCVHHPDRPGTFIRSTRLTKPIPQTVQARECEECAGRKVKGQGIISSTVRRV